MWLCALHIHSETVLLPFRNLKAAMSYKNQNFACDCISIVGADWILTTCADWILTRGFCWFDCFQLSSVYNEASSFLHFGGIWWGILLLKSTNSRKSGVHIELIKNIDVKTLKHFLPKEQQPVVNFLIPMDPHRTSFDLGGASELFQSRWNPDFDLDHSGSTRTQVDPSTVHRHHVRSVWGHLWLRRSRSWTSHGNHQHSMEHLLWIQTVKLNWSHPLSIHLCTWMPLGLVNRSYWNRDQKLQLQWKSSRSSRMNLETSSFKRSLKEPTSHQRGVQRTSTTSLGNWGNKKCECETRLIYKGGWKHPLQPSIDWRLRLGIIRCLRLKSRGSWGLNNQTPPNVCLQTQWFQVLLHPIPVQR